MKGVSARAYSTNYFRRLTLESWYTNVNPGGGVGGPPYETDGDACRLAWGCKFLDFGRA